MFGMHNGGAMAPIIDRQDFASWLNRLSDGRTRAAFVADVLAHTSGWKLERTRLGRYMSGSLPVGRETLAHFNEYAAAIGKPPYAPTPPEDQPPDLPTALLALAHELAALREERQSMAARVDELEAQVGELLAAVPSGGGSAARAARAVPAQ